MCSDETAVCIQREDSVTGGTLFCVILLAVIFFGGLVVLFGLCCRDRRLDKRLRAQKEAAAIAKASAVSSSVPAAAAAAATTRPQRPVRSVSANSNRSGDPFVDGSGRKTPQ